MKCHDLKNLKCAMITLTSYISLILCDISRIISDLMTIFFTLQRHIVRDFLFVNLDVRHRMLTFEEILSFQ